MNFDSDIAIKMLRALDYPYWCPETSYLFFGDGFIHFEHFDINDPKSSTVRLSSGELTSLQYFLSGRGIGELEKERHVVIAHGSNASPVQLAFKFSGKEAADPIIPVIRTTLRNYAVVYAAQFSLYGAVPATLAPIKGVNSSIYVNLLTDEQLAMLNTSEGLGDRYNLERLPLGEVVLDGTVLEREPRAYIATGGALWLDESYWSVCRLSNEQQYDFPAATQREILSRVKRLFRHEGDPEEFIVEQLNDDRKRHERNDLLRSLYSKSFTEALKEVFDVEGERQGE